MHTPRLRKRYDIQSRTNLILVFGSRK